MGSPACGRGIPHAGVGGLAWEGWYNHDFLPDAQMAGG